MPGRFISLHPPPPFTPVDTSNVAILRTIALDMCRIRSLIVNLRL